MSLSNRWERVVVLALFAASFAVPLAAQKVPGDVHPNVIYGSDDRLDLYQVKNAKVRALADSTVALFQGSGVTADPSNPGSSVLPIESYGESMSLCKEEPFYEQPNGAFCSGSLVAPDIIMTAGHCVKTQWACEGIKFVFGFSIKEQGDYPKSVATSDVYGCAQLLGRGQVNDGADWALVRLDRKVSGHEPLELNRSGVVKKGAPMFVIGHPAGLPTKVAGGATVRDETPEGYFVANLDTYGGNSGSAVFNGINTLVEGILVRGETDYVWKDGCQVSNEVPDDGGRGEDVTKITAVFGTLPAPQAKQALESPGEAALSLLGQANVEPRLFGVSGAAALLDQVQTRDLQ